MPRSSAEPIRRPDRRIIRSAGGGPDQSFIITMQVGVPPHIIIVGMPICIIDIMRLHITAHISLVIPCPGVISIIMPFARGFIVQVIIIIIGIMSAIMPIIGVCVPAGAFHLYHRDGSRMLIDAAL
jgi:hypothetical protein